MKARRSAMNVEGGGEFFTLLPCQLVPSGLWDFVGEDSEVQEMEVRKKGVYSSTLRRPLSSVVDETGGRRKERTGRNKSRLWNSVCAPSLDYFIPLLAPRRVHPSLVSALSFRLLRQKQPHLIVATVLTFYYKNIRKTVVPTDPQFASRSRSCQRTRRM